MEKLKAKWLEMNLYRRVLLAVMLAEILGFLIANVIAVNRPGLEYQDALLYPRTEGALQIYEGKLDGEPARFTVSEGEVSYQWGEFSYGPYQVTVDPAAFPETLGEHDGKYNIGLEISQGGTVLFRGGYRPGDFLSLWDESGEPVWNTAFSVRSSGEEATLYVDGREVTWEEQHEPGLGTLARIVLHPELTHRGNVWLYLAVTLLAAVNCFQICFPRFFFRLSLWSRVRNIDDVEPSDWYIAMENIEWAVLAIVCLVLYAMSLTEIM